MRNDLYYRQRFSSVCVHHHGRHKLGDGLTEVVAEFRNLNKQEKLLTNNPIALIRFALSDASNLDLFTDFVDVSFVRVEEKFYSIRLNISKTGKRLVIQRQSSGV